ncbi:hypothetical protein A4X09_0g5784 [Tilletia walkeri]|uniref:U6 snRNA phosphodiesterase 1 n=1 Tax=Tilletia walkeri TaxID=117179 RepID=A0A8X7T3R1_9BASI|nr:hypothetical protein A4X09_0g5784 [Tilletia walkeri]
MVLLSVKKLSSFGASPSPSPSEVLTPNKAKTLKPGQLEGDWLCHAFIRVPVSNDLRNYLGPTISALSSDKDNLPDLEVTSTADSVIKTELDPGTATATGQRRHQTPTELHISLTRPILVRPHEREDFRKLVQGALEDRQSFQIHFARLTTLTNDDSSRIFFVLEVGTGWEELHNLTTALNKPLHSAFRARSYYTEARYHASIASIPLPPHPSSHQTLRQAAETTAARLDNTHARKISKCPAFTADTVGIRVGTQVSTVTLL